MTKFLSIFILFMALLVPSVSKSQGTIVFGSDNCNRWILAQNGRGSFYMNTSSDYVLVKGYYFFNIYFFSNASNPQGYLTAAYIENVTVSALFYDPNTGTNKWKVIFTSPYVLVQPKSQNYDGANNVAYVYSTNMYQKIKVSWTSSSPY